MATLAAWQATIVDEAGNVQALAAIEVRREVAGQPPAACFSNRDGSGALGSTFNADADGFVRFHAFGGAYQITATLGAFSRTWRYQAIGTAAETDAGLVASLTPNAWRFDDATADADPGSGMFRLNNADPAAATAAYVDNLNAGEVDVSAWLDTLDDSGETTNRGMLSIFEPTDPTVTFHTYLVSGTVVDGTGYRKLTLTHIAGDGSFVDGGEYAFAWYAKGATGDVPSSRTLTAGAGLTGGGDLSANRTFDVGAGTGVVVNANDVAIDKASDANVRAAASNKALTSDLLESASALVTLTETAGAVAVDWDTFVNGTVTVDQNSVISNPTNGQPGTWRTILVQGNDTTDRTITFGTEYEGEVPTITDCDNGRWYLLMIYCVTASHFTVSSKRANG